MEEQRLRLESLELPEALHIQSAYLLSFDLERPLHLFDYKMLSRYTPRDLDVALFLLQHSVNIFHTLYGTYESLESSTSQQLIYLPTQD